jgi:acyl carrier protein
MLVSVLLTVKPALDASAIRPDSSLTADLGLSSLDLAELASRLDDGAGPIDLSPWLAQAMRPGGDTVGSLATLLSSVEIAQ